MCFNFRTPENINFPFGTNGKFIILGVSILKQGTVLCLKIGTPKELGQA